MSYNVDIIDRELEIVDRDVSEAIGRENSRQEDHIELIASENYASKAVMEAQGSQLTNKYAEGYADKRYYGGCEHVDTIENLAISRAKELFGAIYANVQPHSGSQANAAVFSALLSPGDTILGMSLDHGGHLTHGSHVSFSGKMYNAVSYGIDDQGQLDYDEIQESAIFHQPKMIIAGFSAFSGIVDWARFRQIADSVGAFLLVDMAHVAGLVAAGLYPDPLPHAHVVTSTTHKTLAGPRGGLILTSINDEQLHKQLNSGVFPCNQGGPLMHVIAAKAVAFKEAMEPSFKVYQQQVIENAKMMVSCFIERGYKVVGGGTSNHMFLLDLSDKDITGKQADAALGACGITVNKNSVPNDRQSPFVTSGVRIGTPAITRRGMIECDAELIANTICDILDDVDNETVREYSKHKMSCLCDDNVVYW